MTADEKAVVVAMLLEYLRTHGVDVNEAMFLLRPKVVLFWYKHKDIPCTKTHGG